jgi:hypothetical protein
MGRTPATWLSAIAMVVGLAGCADGGSTESAAAEEGTPSSATGSASAAPSPTSPDPSELASLAASANAAASSMAAESPPRPPGRVFGADISWPQCPKGMGIPQKRTQGQPMPTDAAEFVVIGLTNGPSFVANPCLADQVDWARDRSLMVAAYAVLSYPDERTVRELGDEGPFDGDTPLGSLRNVGYQAARFNLGSMQDAGLESPIVWVDVEPVTSFEWSDDLVANAAVVEGAVRGYTDGGVRIGFYSIPTLWQRVVGDLRFEAPEWRAAGQTSQQEALGRCASDWSFQGGTAFLGQWVEDNRDRNVTCPGQARELHRWFHRY